MHVIKGAIERIEFENINKARGHFTYNTHIYVKPDSLEPPSDWAVDPVVKIRLNYRPTWKTLKLADREALSADGPKPRFFPDSWREYKVGEPVELKIRFTSQNLAHLVVD